MTLRKMKDLFEKRDGEYLKFENIPAERRKSVRPDLHAFLLLDEIVLPEEGADMISASEHDEFFLEVSLEDVAAKITEEQVLDLIRCGLRVSEYDCFAIFA